MEKGINLNNARREFYNKIVIIAIPVVIQNLIIIGLNMVDTLMVGMLGEEQLAGVGSANQVYMLFSMMCFGFYSGASVYVAQYWGIRDVKTIKKLISIDYTVGVSIAAIMTAIAFIFAPQLIWIFSRDELVIGYGSDYLRIACFTYIIVAITMTISFNSRAIQRLVATTVINGCALVVNTILNYVLIFGKFGFEAMGVKGAATATLIARILELIAMITFVNCSRNHPLKVKLSQILKIDKELFARVFKTALPVVATEGGWSICVSLVFSAYGIIGPAAQAVVQVAGVVADLFQCMYFGLCNATAVIIGEALGRGEKEGPYYYSRLSLRVTCVLNIIMTVLLILMRVPIARIYNFDPETTQLLILTLAAWAITITPKMLAYILIGGILRAGGDTFYSLIVDFSLNVLQVPIAFISVCFLQVPLYIVVMLVSLTELVKTVICYFRWRSRKWMNQMTEQSE